MLMNLNKGQSFCWKITFCKMCEGGSDMWTGGGRLNLSSYIDILRSDRDNRHFAYDLFKCILMNEYFAFCLKLHMYAFIPENLIDNTTSRLHVLAVSNVSLNMMTSSNGNIFHVTGPLCGEFTGPGEFPTQRPVTRSFDVFFDLRLNKRLSKQPWGWWFETPSWSLWRQCNDHLHSLCAAFMSENCQKCQKLDTSTPLVCHFWYWYGADIYPQ